MRIATRLMNAYNNCSTITRYYLQRMPTHWTQKQSRLLFPSKRLMILLSERRSELRHTRLRLAAKGREGAYAIRLHSPPLVGIWLPQLLGAWNRIGLGGEVLIR